MLAPQPAQLHARRSGGAFLRDTRGANLVEYVILVGAVALLSIGMFRLFGQSVNNAIESQGKQVSSVEAPRAGAGGAASGGAGGGVVSGGTSTVGGGDGKGARAGGGGNGASTAANAYGATRTGREPKIEASKDGKSWAIVLVALVIIVAFIVTKVRKTIEAGA